LLYKNISPITLNAYKILKMSLGFLSCFKYFSLSSLKGLNWFEGFKRIKVFLQWIWGVPAGFIVIYMFANKSSIESMVLGVAILSPILGIELLFRVVVWIIGGFLHDGNASYQVGTVAQGLSHEEKGKKKLAKQTKYWLIKIKEIKPHHFYWAIFIPLWFYIWFELVSKTGFSPTSHWRESGFKFPPVNLSLLEDLRLCWYVFVTILRGLLALLVLLFGYHVYQSIEENVLLRQEQKKTN
jgi:hypothetical protein